MFTLLLDVNLRGPIIMQNCIFYTYSAPPPHLPPESLLPSQDQFVLMCSSVALLPPSSASHQQKCVIEARVG